MGFSLTPADVPSPNRTKRSRYEGMLDEFLASGLASARVDGTNQKPATLAAGLRKASEMGKKGVSVVQRGDEIYVSLEAADSESSARPSTTET